MEISKTVERGIDKLEDLSPAVNRNGCHKARREVNKSD